MKKIILLILNFCLITSAYAQSSFRLGVNLERTGAFVNVINNTYRISKATGYDSLGWSLSDFDLVLLDGRPATEWTGVIDDPEQYRINYSGRYKASFKGLATVSVTGTSVTIENRRYDTLSNTSFFDVVVGGYPNANHGMVFLSFTNTKRTLNSSANSGLTKLKVNRPGYELNTDKIFTDEFINLCKAADFACYRYYGMQNIWDGEPVYPAKTTWDKRKKPNDASQEPLKGIGKIDGWCWEYIVELANILKKDIWINIHISCDSAYVLTLAQYLKDNLDGNINIYVENSNEVWNASQVTQGLYNKAQADFYKINFDQNYARRVVELSNLFAQVYGANEINKKIRVILASQHSWSARSDTHLNYIKSAFGEPKNYIYALSPALYFGSTKATSTDPLVINDGMIEDINDQITNAQAGTYRLNHINKAKQWGFTGGCTSYEGGPGLPASGGTANLGNQILANRTEKMGDIIKKSYIEGWKDLDGGLALYFTLFSGYNRYGCWGITDDYSNPDRNYKMKAIREIISGYSDGVNEN
ncbi:MAG: hypothetical protein WCT77_12005, partial [Bacteroidota bacterium]